MIALQSRGAFGHIAHSRESSRIDLTQIQAMQVRSQAVAAYIDKKSIAPADYHNLRALLRGAGIPEIGESELLSLGELDFSTYLTLRKKAEILSHGSAVHPHHLSGSGVPVIAEIPGDLLDEAVRVDEKAASDMIRSLPAAHITGSDGKLLPVFFTFEEHRSALINHLITFCVKLISGCANTAVEGDRLIICRTRFDPRKARDLGIPREQFGRLAGGQAIEMNGTIITPVMVQTGSVKEIHIPGLARYL
jgi:D-aminoacyl-tRNA deacylase